MDTDLARLNSLTKYPSIPTYHGMGDRGRLSDERTLLEGRLHVTEKIDGTNARIAVLPDGDFFIGSREELLYARGDRIGNPALGIVDAVKSRRPAWRSGLAPWAMTGWRWCSARSTAAR